MRHGVGQREVQVPRMGGKEFQLSGASAPAGHRLGRRPSGLQLSHTWARVPGGSDDGERGRDGEYLGAIPRVGASGSLQRDIASALEMVWGHS